MSYLSQSAVEYDALSATAKRKLCPPEMIALTYMAQKKYDGVSAIIFTGFEFMGPESDGPQVLSRTGEDYTVSCGHLLREARSLFGPNVVLFGEVWHPTMEFEEISGDFRRHSPADHLMFVAFDMVDKWEYSAGHSPLEYRYRYEDLFNVLIVPEGNRNSPIILAETYNPGTYGTTQQFLDSVMSKPGFDGIIQRLPDSPWIPGKDKHGYVLKTKPTVTLDLKVLGSVEGKGRNVGKVGALTCRLANDRTVNINVPEDKDRIAFLTDLPDIIEVECMKINQYGSLREPRFKRVRFDTTPDF